MTSTQTRIPTTRLSSSLEKGLPFPQVQLNTFDIPGARKVHGNFFPLGLAVEDNTNPSLDEVNVYIKELAGRGEIRNLLTKHGAILFCGLPIKTPTDLTSFVEAFNFVQPHQEVGLSGKRTEIAKHIKTASEMPPDVKFYFHNEYARSAHFPELIFFWSERVPEKDGETPIVSSIELYDRVKAELPGFLEALISKGVIGRQYYPSIEDPEWKEIGWNWKDSYGFDIKDGDSLEIQRQKVEAVLDQYLKAKAEWQSNGALHVLQHVPAVRRLKSTGQPTFFNGLAGTYGNARDNGALEPPYRNKNGIGYKLPTSYRDGSPIPNEYLERLIEIQESISFKIPWKVGDVALVNNYSVQHGRTPWVGDRSLLVSSWDDIDDF